MAMICMARLSVILLFKHGRVIISIILEHRVAVLDHLMLLYFSFIF